MPTGLSLAPWNRPYKSNSEVYKYNLLLVNPATLLTMKSYHQPHGKDGDTSLQAPTQIIMYLWPRVPSFEMLALRAWKREDICQWTKMKLKPALRNLPHRFPGQTIRASLGCALTLCIMILCSTLIFVSIFKIWGIFFVSFIQFNVFFKTLINKTYSFVCGGGRYRHRGFLFITG